jgi:short subunit dehydrogenase-like uncharacterized protein
MIENLHRGGLVRRGGVLTPVPAAYKTRFVDFGRGPRRAMTIPWGDVSTAFHSTGIPNIEVYVGVPPSTILSLKLLRPFLSLAAKAPVQAFLKRRVRAGAPGPNAAARERGRCFLWGEVEDDSGRKATARSQTPEGYTLTAMTAVAIAERVLAGEAPAGFMTPSKAYGPDFVLGIEGVTREDL